ncbi:phage major capsid protein [Blastomonas sp. CCH5-A3]|jgi:HK97 family phage major capsid protein|uniref:phage major capsid protein n=1 Tax=Blastomonas sp. CCH5-A3 TaxID=1768761 RepID=UPI000824DE07|nr:phage major capsid protein [Blastomonas sp. CCH5-A3]MAF60211.1 phage major capsid protein [Blastomonas sp.]|tara:strand:+ start:119657 stop:120946 length:1290 start_codon:yes stop_codon:yes gene_type:complete
MILQQYYEERGTLVAEARSILDSIANETDQTRITEAEQRHDAVMAKLDALDKKIEREERQAARETAEEERRKQNRPNRGSGSASGVDDPESGEDRTAEQAEEEYRDAFYAMLREGGDMSALSAESRQLLRRGYVENRVQTAGTDAAGGFTVPTTLANFIVSTMKDWGPMYDPGITTELVTSSGNAFDIPTNDDTGNTAALKSEGADLTDDDSGDLAFGEKNLNAYVYATPWLKISFELLQDSAFNLEAFIGAKLGERLGRIANQRLTIGTGSSQPNGIVTAAAIGKTAAAAAAIAADELIDLQHSVNAAYRRSPRCGWMFADTTLASIRKLKDGQGNYLWQMGDVRVGAPDLILGKQYYVNDDVAAMAANARSVVFGDMGAYIVRKVGSPLIGTVRERFWPKVGMAGLVRFDGELTDTAAVKVLRQAAS